MVGYIKQDLSFIYPWFTVENADGETVLKIKGPCWTCKWCDVEFEVCLSNVVRGMSPHSVTNWLVTCVTTQCRIHKYIPVIFLMPVTCPNFRCIC